MQIVKSYEIVPIMPRLTQLEQSELKLLEHIIMKDGEVREETPDFFIRRFEYLITKFIEIAQAQLN